MYSDYLSRVDLRFDTENNIEVHVSAYRSDLVRVWPEAMLAEFLRYREEKRAEIQKETIRIFTDEMAQVSKKMEEVLNQQFEFQATNEMTELLIELEKLRNVPRDIAMVVRRLDAMDRISRALKFESGLSAAEKLAMLASIKRDMSLSVGEMVPSTAAPLQPTVLGVSPQQSVVPPATAPPAQIVVLPSMVAGVQGDWESLEKEKIEVEKQIRELSKVYLPANPRMAPHVKRLDEINKKLEGELESAARAFQAEYNTLLERKKELEEKRPFYDDILKKSAKFKQDYSVATAGQLAWSKMYEEMARAVSSLNFGAEKERVHLRFLGVDELRDVVPVSPNRLKLVLLSLAFGLALAVGVPFLIEFLDHTVTNLEDVEDTFGLRGLGVVPKIGHEHLTATPIIDLENKTDRFLVENFRVIRANLLAAASAKPPQVIMIASAMPQEGKTVISTNLAVSFAQMGEKTILIDADLRRGRLHRLFGLRSKPGLSNVFLENINLEEACRPSGKPNLWILSCGNHLDGATEFFGAPTFHSLMQSLRQRYDRIIIDTPPVLGLSETAMMQNCVDGVVFVIWSGRTPSRNVKTAIDTLRANHANLYGFVLNRLDLSSTTNYYYYYYYSNNYYYSYQAVPEKS
ncbi:MAG: polysaccharide biosynthesis tyrosine autokinase [Verrucomicrobiota bacterium]